MDSLQNFTFEKQGAVVLVKLNRPKSLNCFNENLFAEMDRVLSLIENDGEIRCVVVAGAGAHFSAGIDLQFLGTTTSQWSARNVFQLHNLFSRWEALPQPVICAIHGACMGAGLEFALATDIRLAAEDAKFSMPEVKFGLSPDLGGSQRLPRTVGPSQAKRLMLSCETIDAQEAARIGLVDELLEPSQLMERAMKLANTIANQPPLAVRFGKTAVNLAMESSKNAGLLFEQVQSIFTLGTDDKNEAVAAFIEKRMPVFTGQ